MQSAGVAALLIGSPINSADRLIEAVKHRILFLLQGAQEAEGGRALNP